MALKKLLLFVVTIYLIFIFNGCTARQELLSNIDKTLQQSTNVKIYTINLDKLDKSMNIYTRLHEFPFVSTDAMLDFRGNFPVEFYQTMNHCRVNAQNIKDVNFWKLRDYPFTLDVIYVKPIWIENFKYVSKDLFENICYSFNISKREQAILKWWIKNGGILWIESGIYATGFENLTRYGRINLPTLRKKINLLTKNVYFINFPVSSVTYISKYISLSGYTPKTIVYKNIRISNNFFKDLTNLKIVLRYPLETFFSIPKGSIIKDRAGNTILSVIPYYEGKIIFLFPFEYVDSYKNGELLRWKLLQYICYTPHYSKPIIKMAEQKADNITRIEKKKIINLKSDNKTSLRNNKKIKVKNK